jgi:hypothetical protein
MRTYLEEFCQEIDFPKEAIEALGAACSQLEEHKEGKLKFLELVEYFKEHSEKKEHKSIISRLNAIGEETGINQYTLHMLYAIALSKHTRVLYEQKGISHEIFLDTMYDLKAKLMECYQLHEVWGTEVFWWEIDLFNLSLIALGRLQFEVIEYEGEYEGEMYNLKNGDKVLNMHIPSGKPLDCKECKESFKKAAEFYKEYFVDRPVAFVCMSWLLYPAHREFLPENSNILKFMDFFHIVSWKKREDKRYLWRIFYKDWEKEPKELPRSSSLQRAYADWLINGNPAGEGHGVFFV